MSVLYTFGFKMAHGLSHKARTEGLVCSKLALPVSQSYWFCALLVSRWLIRWADQQVLRASLNPGGSPREPIGEIFACSGTRSVFPVSHTRLFESSSALKRLFLWANHCDLETFW